jgi:hypothetical protein
MIVNFQSILLLGSTSTAASFTLSDNAQLDTAEAGKMVVVSKTRSPR